MITTAPIIKTIKSRDDLEALLNRMIGKIMIVLGAENFDLGTGQGIEDSTFYIMFQDNNDLNPWPIEIFALSVSANIANWEEIHNIFLDPIPGLTSVARVVGGNHV